jgi:phosphatidylserine decarboxylase
VAIIDFIYSSIQYVLPHHLLSGLARAITRTRIGLIKNLLIWIFGWLSGVDWEEAKSPHAVDYVDFNAFFTRALAPGARPLDPDPMSFVSPCDGRISQCGRVTNDRLLQAKGHSYSLRALLAHDPVAREFANGFFHTIYLAPRDYHRVHMPMAGSLQRMIHVPGRLFSVSPPTVRQVPNLFTRNERAICLFDTTHGPMAVVLVGAMLVSGLETVWAGNISPPRARRITTGDWSRRDINLERGEELGRFNFGSTVLLLLPATAVSTLADLGPDDNILMGEKLGRLR